MAKKPKKAEEPEAAGAPGAGEAKARFGKPLILGAAGLAALGALSGGGYWFYAQRGGEAAETQKTIKPVAFVDIREMMINLANEPNPERPKVLKFRAELEVKAQKPIADIQPTLPRI